MSCSESCIVLQDDSDQSAISIIGILPFECDTKNNMDLNEILCELLQTDNINVTCLSVTMNNMIAISKDKQNEYHAILMGNNQYGNLALLPSYKSYLETPMLSIDYVCIYSIIYKGN